MTREGIQRARTVRRMEPAKRADKALLMEAVGTPWNTLTRQPKKQAILPPPVPTPAPPVEAEAAPPAEEPKEEATPAEPKAEEVPEPAEAQKEEEAVQRTWGEVPMKPGDFSRYADVLSSNTCGLFLEHPSELCDSLRNDAFWMEMCSSAPWITVARLLHVQNDMWRDAGWDVPYPCIRALQERAMRQHEANAPWPSSGDDLLEKLGIDCWKEQQLENVRDFPCRECKAVGVRTWRADDTPAHRARPQDVYCFRCRPLPVVVAVGQRWLPSAAEPAPEEG